jgi:hypothetical protein
MPRSLVLTPAAKLVASPENVSVVPLTALVALFAIIMNAPKPFVLPDAALMPFTTLAVLVPVVPVVLMVPPCQAKPAVPVLVAPVALRYWPERVAPERSTPLPLLLLP